MKLLLTLILIASLVGAGMYFSGPAVNRISPDADMLQLGSFAFQEKRYEDAFNWYQHAANQGLSKGQFKLSQLYQRGQGVEKDMAMAVHWMASSAKQGFAAAEYEYALMMEFGRGITKAKASEVAIWYQKAAEQNHPEAMLKVARLFHTGIGLPKSASQALAWAIRAEKRNAPDAVVFRQKITKDVADMAHAGDAQAQYMLATLYDEGRGVEKNKDDALAWFSKAAKQGHSEAQYALAKALVESGDESKLAQALTWFEKAAKQGHEQAGSATVAILAMQGVTGKRAREAWRWMYYGMKMQDPKAYYNLASAMQSGMFGLQDVKVDAGDWLEAAAQAGISQAQNDYAIYLKLQHHDTQHAIQWLNKAATSDAKAQFNLGFIYARGDGVTPDDDSAVRWWGLAEKNGSTRAKMMLGLFYDLGRGVGRSEAKAVAWYQKAADLGDVNALFNLAVLYYNGRGIDRD
ncbi:MAG: tetratricopeptide repeat protein, partial [Ghiorsea sp.]